MTTYTREELKEAASCLNQFVELFLQQDKSRKPMLFAMAADILNQLAEAEPRAYEVTAHPVSRILKANRYQAAINKYEKSMSYALYQFPIKESNDN